MYNYVKLTWDGIDILKLLDEIDIPFKKNVELSRLKIPYW